MGASSEAATWVVALVTIGPSLLCLLLLWLGFRNLSRRRLIENLPTSKVAGVFLGLTEVKGHAERTPPLRSYLAELEVVYYHFSVEEEERRTETYTDSQGKRRTRTTTSWRTVRSGEQRLPFFLRDDTGAIRVNPTGSKVEPARVFSRTCGRSDPIYYGKGPRYALAGSTHRRRFTEHAILAGQDIYVLGSAWLREDILEPEIRHDSDAPLFLISTRPEEAISRAYGWKAAFALVGGSLMGVTAPLAFEMSRYGASWGEAWHARALLALLITAVYWLFALCLYLQLVYNGLIDVRNRHRRAFSMIDVELKRRHDLIPALVNVVRASAGHELKAHEAVAALRHNASRPPAESDDTEALQGAANAQTDALGRLFGLVERYPALKSDTAFLALHEELTKTERRIALARSFYNDSVTAYNDRLHTLPDLLVARPFGFVDAPHLEMAEFERHPVEVRFEAEPEPEPLPAAQLFAAESLPEGAKAVDANELVRGEK